VCVNGKSAPRHLCTSTLSPSWLLPCDLLQGYGSAPPPSPGDLPLWAHQPLPTPVPPHRRVYCNRALNMKNIKASQLLTCSL
jgi:hypothetical protein